MRAFIIAVVLALLIGETGCGRDSPTMLFILPNGFSGLFVISEDRNNGVILDRTNNAYPLEIPENGRLAVKSFAPFNHWHKVSAKFKDGKNLPVATTTRTSEIALHELPSVGGIGIYYFVGSQSEFDAISRKHDFYKFPLATKITPNE